MQLMDAQTLPLFKVLGGFSLVKYICHFFLLPNINFSWDENPTKTLKLGFCIFMHESGRLCTGVHYVW